MQIYHYYCDFDRRRLCMNDMTPPFFSIIVPTFNSEKDVCKLLKSIITQSFQEFEILVMDGLSTDRTVQIAEGFADKRIRIISEKDSGIYDAMNKGIKASNGSWLYFIGADDTLYNDFVLENVNRAIVHYKVQRMIYGNVRIVGDSGPAEDGSIYDGAFALSKLIVKNICHQSIFYNRQVFAEIGIYDKKYSICADHDLNLRCYSRYESYYIDIIVANFCAEGISSKKNDPDFFLGDNVIRYFSKSLYKKDFKPLKGAFTAYARRHFAEDGYKGYLRMKVLKLWHQYFS